MSAGRRKADVPHPPLTQLCLNYGTADPRLAVVRAVRSAVAAARAMGWEGPPFDPVIIASLRGYRVESKPSLGDPRREAAWVTPNRIVVRSDLKPKRRRYAIAHEVVHGIIEDAAAVQSGSTSSGPDDESQLEKACQAGAAEILMPADCVQGQLTPDLAGIQLVRVLSQGFETSAESAARRCVELSERPVVVVTAARADRFDSIAHLQQISRTHRVEVRGDDMQVVAWIPSPSHRMAPRIAAGEPIPRKSGIRRSYFSAKKSLTAPAVFVSRETWPAYPELGEFTVVAAPLPLDRKPYGSFAFLWFE